MMTETPKTLAKANEKESNIQNCNWAGILINTIVYTCYLIITCGIQFQDANSNQLLGWDIYEIIVIIFFLIVNSCNIYFRNAKFVSYNFIW